MNKYDKNSLKAEEFINDGEILDSLKFADENKNNLELVDKIIEKARLKKGINHREASVLLACEDKERLKEIYNLARQIKKDFYGDRIVMFAPLYLSNYCVNGCVYCPYHAKNKHICRKSSHRMRSERSCRTSGYGTQAPCDRGRRRSRKQPD